jgi:hypothetical protein
MLLLKGEVLVTVREHLLSCRDQLAEVGCWYDRNLLVKMMNLRQLKTQNPLSANLPTRPYCDDNCHMTRSSSEEMGEEETAFQAAGLAFETVDTMGGKMMVDSEGFVAGGCGVGSVEQWSIPPLAKYRAQVEVHALHAQQQSACSAYTSCCATTENYCSVSLLSSLPVE